jgi:hypothetical protein
MTSAGQDRNEGGEELPRVNDYGLSLATPRRLPKAARLPGRVVVLDIAFASESGGRRKGFEKTTLRFIEQLGPRLVGWIDHHDSVHHARFADDPRFVLATKAQHGACPEMITPALVKRLGSVDTIVCHTDFDGLASAAKWILAGEAPYPDCDSDARAIDTRVGEPGPIGQRFDRALRATRRDEQLRIHIVRQLAGQLRDETLWQPIDEAGAALVALERRARTYAEGYRQLSDELVMVELGDDPEPYDRTLLLLLGQQRARMALVLDGDNATFAAPFDSGVSFVERFGLSGGMPTLVSIHRAKLADALSKLGVPSAAIATVAEPPARA